MIIQGQCWRPAGSTLEFLAGRWRAERVLTDFRSGITGTFTGVASLTWLAGPAAAAGALDYQEHGELVFGGHRGPASRSLLYLPAPDGAALVRFADGRPFYRLDLRSGRCEAEHPCGRDSYLMAAAVLGPGAYTEQWRASGPGKDYVMTTTLTRIGAAG